MTSIPYTASRISFNPPQPGSAVSMAGRLSPRNVVPANSAVRFGGAGDAFSAFFSFIQSNRGMELFSSDFLGMLCPRTGVAAGFRGTDDARETFIREGAGLVCVALLAGLTNQALIRVLGNRAGFYNPQAIPAKAWIGARPLREFSQLFEQELNAKNSPAEARQSFVERIVRGLESGDRELSIVGRLKTLKSLLNEPGNEKSVEKALGHMLKALPGAEAQGKFSAQDALTLLKGGEIERLREEFLNRGWGKLSPQGEEALIKAFAQKATGDTKTLGTTSFDRMAWDAVKASGKDVASPEAHKAFLKARMGLSVENLKKADAAFTEKINQLALEQGLTSVVNLKAGAQDGKGALLAGHSRQTMLKEMKYFLEHFVDRSVYEATEKGAALSVQAQKQRVQERLFSPSAKGLASLLPHHSDGLVTAALKSKRGYTWIPIGVAIAANGITTFMNNYITQRKYSGKVFFPGEEAFIPQGSNRQAASQRPSVSMKGGWA